jgi:tRNA-Thr(GGU) m(6)t(6)A37 methyltransferase TsaA
LTTLKSKSYICFSHEGQEVRRPFPSWLFLFKELSMIKKDSRKPFSLIPIGVLHTPFKRSEECPFQGAHAKATGKIVVDKRFQRALKDLDGVTHLFLLTFMHLADRKKLQTVTPHGPDIHGTFATRSPHRPNPIGLSVVRLIKIKGRRLYVQGVDCLDGTPVIDIKPYNPDIDAFPRAVAGWHKKVKKEKRGKRLICLSR